MKKSTDEVLSRQKRILGILANVNNISMQKLEKQLGVTSKVAWRDISILCELGLVEKAKGKVNLKNHFAFDRRLCQYSKEKKAIAHYVLNEYLLREDTGIRVCIFMDAGSTVNLLFQEMLSHELVDTLSFNIVTNNLSLAGYRYPDNINLIFTGGQYLPHDKCLVGKATELFSQYRAKLAIMSSTNISFNGGYLGHNFAECQTKQSMIRNAEEVIILSDDSKFQFLGGELISELTWAEVNGNPAYGKQLEVKLHDGERKPIKVITNSHPEGRNQEILNKFFGEEVSFDPDDIDNFMRLAPMLEED